MITITLIYHYIYIQKPERLEGNRYTVQSDIWSLGLSLVELAIGRYPIPIASDSEVASLFEIDPHGQNPRSEGRCGAQSLAIFELLEYIVNQVSCIKKDKKKQVLEKFLILFFQQI